MPSVAESYNLPQDARRFLPSSELVLPTCYVGVEAELERTQGRQIAGLWQTKQDGSLHDDGLEYVFTYPLYGQDVVDALHALEAAFSGTPPSTGVDTSLHVHVDVRDLTTQQLSKMILLYIIYEQVLFNYCAPEREDNIFCLSVDRQKSMLSQYSTLYNSLLAGASLSMRSSTAGMPRYMGMNLASINKFGTLEFRGHRGEWRAAPILRWVNILQCIKRAALDDSIPHERPYVAIKSRGVTAFTQDVFGQYYEVLNNDDLHEQIHVGMQLARSIVNMASPAVINLTDMGARAGATTCTAIAAAHGRAYTPAPNEGYEILRTYYEQEFPDFNSDEVVAQLHAEAPAALELIGAAANNNGDDNDWFWDMVHAVATQALEGRYHRIMSTIAGFLDPPSEFEDDDYEPDDEWADAVDPEPNFDTYFINAREGERN